MYIKVDDIVKTLDNHPYFSNLSSEEKLAVINIAVSEFNNTAGYNNRLFLLAVPPNKLGADGSLTSQFVIPSLSQTGLEPLSRFVYDDLETMTESLLSDISEEAKMVVYSIAVSKIRSLRSNLYEITSSLDSVLARTYKSVEMNLSLSKNYFLVYPDIHELIFGLPLQSNINIFGSQLFSLELPLNFYYEITERFANIIELALSLNSVYKVSSPVEISMNLPLSNGYNKPIASSSEMDLTLAVSYDVVFS